MADGYRSFVCVCVCVFIWFTVMIFVRPELYSSFAEVLYREPISLVPTVLACLGIDVFLYWLVAGKSSIGIDDIRPSGVPLGLVGFFFSAVCLLILGTLRK